MPRVQMYKVRSHESITELKDASRQVQSTSPDNPVSDVVGPLPNALLKELLACLSSSLVGAMFEVGYLLS